MRWMWMTAALAASFLAGSSAVAQESGPSAPPAAGDERPGGRVLLAAKVGGLATFGGMNPNVRAGLEVGYLFGAMNRSFAAVVQVDYAAPKQEKTVDADPRVPGGGYSWHLTEQQLVFMPMALYRFTSLGKLVPFAGIGPRIYLLRSNVKGSAAGSTILETTEQSTKLGLGVPIGVEYQLGPGGLLAHVLLEYGPLDHAATGSSNTGAASLMVGYRFLL